MNNRKGRARGKWLVINISSRNNWSTACDTLLSYASKLAALWESILKAKSDVKFVIFKLCRKQIELAKAQPMAQDKRHPQSKINSKVTPEATVLVSLPQSHTATNPGRKMSQLRNCLHQFGLWVSVGHFLSFFLFCFSFGVLRQALAGLELDLPSLLNPEIEVVRITA